MSYTVVHVHCFTNLGVYKMGNFQNTNPNRPNQTGSSTKTNVSTAGKKQQQQKGQPGKAGGNKQQGKDDCNC